jgi:hypothetical protein
MVEGIKNMTPGTVPSDFLSSGAVLREPIFYGGESAYGFQYCDLAPEKYLADKGWLEKNRGFSAEQAINVAQAISSLQHDRLTQLRENLQRCTLMTGRFCQVSAFGPTSSRRFQARTSLLFGEFSNRLQSPTASETLVSAL